MSLISRVWDAQKNEWVAFQPEEHALPSNNVVTEAARSAPGLRGLREFDVQIQATIRVTGYATVTAESEEDARLAVENSFYEDGTHSRYWIEPEYEEDWASADNFEVVSVEPVE